MAGQTIEKDWARGHVFGLFTPGANVDASDRCPNGVARVETGVSFLNALVGGIPPIGLFYSPMSVEVTCAAGGSASVVSPPTDVAVPPQADEKVAPEATKTAERK